MEEEKTGLKCDYFGDCNFVGMRELLRCEDNFYPENNCQRYKCLKRKEGDFKNQGLQGKLK
jgi:hypothetical protein